MHPSYLYRCHVENVELDVVVNEPLHEKHPFVIRVRFMVKLISCQAEYSDDDVKDKA